MKSFYYFLSFASCLTLVSILSGCINTNPYPYQTYQEAGIQTGAEIGEGLGYEIADGGGAETVGGTILGAMAGSAIGQAMDRHDQMMAENAITDLPLYQDTSWVNDDTGATYTVTAEKEFKKGTAICREAKVTMRSKNSLQYTTTVVCKSASGKWYADR